MFCVKFQILSPLVGSYAIYILSQKSVLSYNSSESELWVLGCPNLSAQMVFNDHEGEGDFCIVLTMPAWEQWRFMPALRVCVLFCGSCAPSVNHSVTILASFSEYFLPLLPHSPSLNLLQGQRRLQVDEFGRRVTALSSPNFHLSLFFFFLPALSADHSTQRTCLLSSTGDRWCHISHSSVTLMS